MTTTKESTMTTTDNCDLETKARYTGMIGTTVRLVEHNGTTVAIGTLESVYVSDGLAVNVIGLVDWSKNGKDYGRDFCLGPLYGRRVVPCPDPWIGHTGGNIVKVYPDRDSADRALYARQVEGVAPYHQPGR